MTMPLISADNHFGLLFVLAGLAAFGFWSERTRVGARISGVILVIAAGLILSNAGAIPFSAPLYDIVWDFAVPLAIPLLLFRADLRRVLPETGPVFISFVIATIGTICGVLAGFHLIVLGPEAPKIVATLGASWIGGSMNFAAVSQALALDDGTLVSAMAAADNVGGTLFLLLLVSMPSIAFMRRLYPSRIIAAAPPPGAEEIDDGASAPLLNMSHIALLLTLSALCSLIGQSVAGWLGVPRYSVLFVTLAALFIANVFPKQMHRLHGDFALGMLFMYVFFGVMGAGADVALMIETALPIFAFTGVMATVHLAVVLVCAKLFRLDFAEVLIASNAVALGPATAAAMAASQRWASLVTPAIMLGVLGYAIANFIGVFLAGILG